MTLLILIYIGAAIGMVFGFAHYQGYLGYGDLFACLFAWPIVLGKMVFETLNEKAIWIGRRK